MAKLVSIAACALALAGAASAQAAPVLEVGPDGAATVVRDPFVPDGPGARLGPPPGHPAAGAAAAPKLTARGKRAVLASLVRARREGDISRRELIVRRRAYMRTRRAYGRLRGTRRAELGSVIATLDSIARGRRLTASRMPALFLTLRRNLEFWPRSALPSTGTQIRFTGSEILFQYYRGEGLQLQPLSNFKQANIMHGACVKDTGEACDRGGLRRLLDELIETRSRRGSFHAWEYFFEFGGGRPPWVSGMAQATAVQALARASRLLDEPRYVRVARRALGAFETPPPVGVATRGPLGGTHYLQYSFAPRLFIINAFLQSVIGLHDFAELTGDDRARALFERAEPEARRELPRNDTGDWSTYSYGGRESTREYHELLREFAAALCSRLRARVYCEAARRFARYTTEPAELSLLAPETVRKGQTVRVPFSVSKLSAVQLVITREGNTALDRTDTFRRGEGSFEWKVRAAGTYTLRLAAKELRTGRGLRTRDSAQVESLP